MKISTVNTIYWIAIASFWALLISDWVTPGKAPAILDLAETLSVYVFLAAYFYGLGANRSTKNTPSYEMSK